MIARMTWDSYNILTFALFFLAVPCMLSLVAFRLASNKDVDSNPLFAAITTFFLFWLCGFPALIFIATLVRKNYAANQS